MRRVNVLCAPPNGRNPGMASVDRAFLRVADEVGVDVTYWRLWDQSEWIDSPGGSTQIEFGVVADETSGMTYHLARGRLQEFLDADAIVFWGDFHHMAVYLDQTADVLHRRIGTISHAEARDLASSYLMLRGQNTHVLDRTVSFGTTLGFNSARNYESTYGDDFKNFAGKVRGAWFRDGYSARVAELVRAPRVESCLGSDAAFLAAGAKQASTPAGIGVFIGRSAVAPEKVAGLGKALTSQLGGPAQWIPWGTAPAMWPMWGRKRLRIAWPELENRGRALNAWERVTHLREMAHGPALLDEVVPLVELFQRIAECQIILTDTYHLAVNAWRIGTPAILLFDSAPSMGWNVNKGEGIGRDKRHDLYSQLDALPLLVDIRATRTRSDIRRLVNDIDLLRGPVSDRAEAIGNRGFGLIVTALQDLLG